MTRREESGRTSSPHEEKSTSRSPFFSDNDLRQIEDSSQGLAETAKTLEMTLAGHITGERDRWLRRTTVAILRLKQAMNPSDQPGYPPLPALFRPPEFGAVLSRIRMSMERIAAAIGYDLTTDVSRRFNEKQTTVDMLRQQIASGIAQEAPAKVTILQLEGDFWEEVTRSFPNGAGDDLGDAAQRLKELVAGKEATPSEAGDSQTKADVKELPPKEADKTNRKEESSAERSTPPTGEESDKAGSTAKKPKRGTAPGEAGVKIIAGLTEHHKFDGDSCLNLEPINVNKFADSIDVAGSTVSKFLKDSFDGFGKYKGHFCRNATTLTVAIQMLRGELPPTMLFNRIEDETNLEDGEE